MEEILNLAEQLTQAVESLPDNNLKNKLLPLLESFKNTLPKKGQMLTPSSQLGAEPTGGMNLGELK